MYQALYVPELFRCTFGDSDKADLAALARTCQGIKEPALDLLWQELDNIFPLVQCFPEAFPLELCFNYTFARPLTEAEQNTLRSYARRVRAIRGEAKFGYVEDDVIRTIFNLAPLTDPLFPSLCSLHWQHSTAFPAHHFAVPSLTSLYLDLQFPRQPFDMEFFDIFGDRCPHMEKLGVQARSCRMEVDVTISRQVCHWPNLRIVYCPNVVLSLDAIKHLSSAPNLRQLSFTAEIDAIEAISHIGSKLVFSSLAGLCIHSKSLGTIALLLSRIQLPAAVELVATFSNRAPKQAIHAFWTAAREASLPIVSVCLYNTTYRERYRNQTYHQLTLNDLPCTTFFVLRSLYINLDWYVSLTDADLFHLASPQTEKLMINDVSGWGMGRDGGGITLTGLVQLLRWCPSLNQLSLAIDTSTFTEIPEGLDVSFPPRNGLKLNFVDSYIPADFVPGVVSVFIALKLDTSMFRAWHTRVLSQEDALHPWRRVVTALELHEASQPSLPSEM